MLQRRRGRVAAGLPPHRHRPGLLQRGVGRTSGSRLGHPARAGLCHIEAAGRGEGLRQGGRGVRDHDERDRPGLPRPLPYPCAMALGRDRQGLPGGEPADLEGDGGVPRQRSGQGHRRVELRAATTSTACCPACETNPMVNQIRWFIGLDPSDDRGDVCRARHRRGGLLPLRARPHREPSRNRRHRGALRRQRTTAVHPLPAAKGSRGAAKGDHDRSHPAERRTRLRDLRRRHGASSTPCATPTSTRTRWSSAGGDPIALGSPPCPTPFERTGKWPG